MATVTLSRCDGGGHVIVTVSDGKEEKVTVYDFSELAAPTKDDLEAKTEVAVKLIKESKAASFEEMKLAVEGKDI